MYKQILNKINDFGFEGYVIGGFVRDRYLGKNSYDIDICTNASPSDIKRIFPNSVEKGLFCFKIMSDKYNIEITSYRLEEEYDGRRPHNLKLTQSLKQDIMRRDFTINGICLDKNENYIDLVDGIKDLNAKVIRCIGDADYKISSDFLRILRAIRFASILNFKLDEKLESAINKYASNVIYLSKYRIRKEFDKILYNNNFEYGIFLLKKFNIDKYLDIIIPDNIVFCDNIMAMYSQMLLDNSYFNKKELKTYNIIKNYLNKELNNYDLFCLDIDIIKIIDQIKHTNYVHQYEKLLIKSVKQLDIKYDDVKNLLPKNINYNTIISSVIKEVLNGNISNKKDDIINYIINY